MGFYPSGGMDPILLGMAPLPTPGQMAPGLYGVAPSPPAMAYAPVMMADPRAMVTASPLPPVKAYDAEILAALQILENTANLPEDEAYLQSLGVNILFRNGREALDVIRRVGASVEFGDTGDPKAHAAWIKNENKMVVNQRYRGNMSLPVLYAIAESIYHEAGHAARLGDDQSSLQEEIDCLALNVMAHRSHLATDPRYQISTTSGPYKHLFEEGVALYPRLFFDSDPHKKALVNRIIKIYGMLPPDSPDHSIPHLPNDKTIAERVLHELQRRSSRMMFAQGQVNA